MASQITTAELDELRDIVYPWHLLNYESDDVLDDIDAVTYVAPDGDTCLHTAALIGDLRAVELLIKAGLDVNRQGDIGNTPLHYAKAPEIVDFLLANGARADIKMHWERCRCGDMAGSGLVADPEDSVRP